MSSEDATLVLTNFLDEWAQHHSRGDVDSLVDLYAERTLFFGSAPDLRTDRAGVRAYFEALEPHDDSSVTFETIAVTAPAPGVVEGASVGTFRWRGNPGIAIRFTHTLVRRADRWVAVAHHASPR